MSHSENSDVQDREAHWRVTTARPILITQEDEVEFMEAMAAYKKSSGRLFPTWSEILEVIRSIGYEKRVWTPVGPDYEEFLDESEPVEPIQGWFSQVELISAV